MPLAIRSGEGNLRQLYGRGRRVIPAVDLLHRCKEPRLLRLEIFKRVDQYSKRGLFLPVDLCPSRKIHLRRRETSQGRYQDANNDIENYSPARWGTSLPNCCYEPGIRGGNYSQN